MSIRKINATYQLGEVVWARVSGYPWWPGQIVQNDRPEESFKYKVQFFAHPTWSYLEANKIAKYEDNFEEFSKHKRVGKRLQASIDAAQDYLSSIITKKAKERVSTLESEGTYPSNDENSDHLIKEIPVEVSSEKQMSLQIQHSNSVEQCEKVAAHKIQNPNRRTNIILIPQPNRPAVTVQDDPLRQKLKTTNETYPKKFSSENKTNEPARFKPVHKETRPTTVVPPNSDRNIQAVREMIQNPKWKRPYIKKIYTAFRYNGVQIFKAQQLSIRTFNRIVSSVDPQNIQDAFIATVTWLYRCTHEDMTRYLMSADRFLMQ